jgi:hypothetical protein
MTDQHLRQLDARSRRNFIKWTAAIGAAVGLDRVGYLNFLADSAGHAVAQEAACTATCKSVHIVAGDGGFAWFQLLWPHVEIAKSGNDNFAFHAFGQVQDAPSDNPSVFGPHTPWKDRNDPTKLISAFMAGQNQTHTRTPLSAAQVGGGSSMLAVAGAIQRATPSLVPVITVDDVPYGTAPGAPSQTNVGNAAAMVDLFNSAASRVTLAIESDAALYEVYYKAYLGMVRAANRPTYQHSLNVGKSASNFLGKNLAAKLVPLDDDLNRYGINDGTPTKLSELGRTLITTAKAFKLGLTQSVVVPAMRDDPHGAFNNMGVLNSTTDALCRYLNQFLIDLDVNEPGCTSGSKLSDSVIITVHGDTPKDPRNRSGWPDGTPGNSNWMYVMGNGYLKTGWFGGIRANGNVNGFDPATGENIPGQSANATSNAASAAVAYAIARGDAKRVADFNGLNISGITNQIIL